MTTVRGAGYGESKVDADVEGAGEAADKVWYVTVCLGMSRR